MRRMVFGVLCVLTAIVLIAGCNKTSQSIVSSQGDAIDSTQTFSLESEVNQRTSAPAVTSSQAVYGSKVERILNADKSNYDYLVTFYLPNNPGSATFQGHAPWGWQTYAAGSAWVYDARWTSSGFRVIIRETFGVVWWCSTVPRNYRLLY